MEIYQCYKGTFDDGWQVNYYYMPLLIYFLKTGFKQGLAFQCKGNCAMEMDVSAVI